MTMLELIGHHKTALRAVVDRQPAAMEGLVAGLVSVAGAPSSVAVVTGPAVGPAASPAERAASGVERSSSWKSDGHARAYCGSLKAAASCSCRSASSNSCALSWSVVAFSA